MKTIIILTIITLSLVAVAAVGVAYAQITGAQNRYNVSNQATPPSAYTGCYGYFLPNNSTGYYGPYGQGVYPYRMGMGMCGRYW